MQHVAQAACNMLRSRHATCCAAS